MLPSLYRIISQWLTFMIVFWHTVVSNSELNVYVTVACHLIVKAEKVGDPSYRGFVAKVNLKPILRQKFQMP